MKDKKYKAAVIGSGFVGALGGRYHPVIMPGTHAGSYEKHDRTTLSAMMDLNPDNIKKAKVLFPGVPCFTSVKEMMEETMPDIVSVAVNTPAHAAVVKEVVAFKPKAILCEKPIARTEEEAMEMITTCRNNNILLLVNHLRRFDPLLREIKDSLREYGPILQGNAYYVRGLINNGTHLIDLLRFYLGEVSEVSAFKNEITATYTDLKNDCNVDALLFFKSGARVAVQSLDSKEYTVFSMILYGKHGRITMRHFGFKVEYEGVINSPEYATLRQLDEENPRIKGDPRSFMMNAIDHVVKCLDGEEKPLSTGEDALGTLRVLDALVKSAHEGGAVVKVRSS